MVKTLSALISCSFSRIQFTPDLLPLDLIGSEIYRPDAQSLEIKKGPIFANIVLADEINRAPSKVQSALLEAMEEKQVTLGDQTHVLQDPFIVMATQNPIEQEGTYTLSEAQMDRFLMKIVVPYPQPEDEIQILKQYNTSNQTPIKKCISKKGIQSIQACIQNVFVDDKMFQYVADIIRQSRPENAAESSPIRTYVQHGLSPRAGIALIRCAQTYALMQGRDFVLPEDIKTLIYPVFQHRMIPSFTAFSEDVSVRDILDILISHIIIP